MLHGKFKLVDHSGRGTLYADVTVRLERSVGSGKINIAESAFDWLKKSYGPNAVLPRDDNEFVIGALKGAKYALGQCAEGDEYNVVIESIRFSPVDSDEDTVAFATCRAVWEALEVEPKSKPHIDQGQICW